MHASFYASVLTFFYFYLSFEVIKQRKIHKVAYGYGNGRGPLAGSVSAHSNFAAYAPIFIILLWLAEQEYLLPGIAVHTLGILFLLGRYLHFVSLTKKEQAKAPVFKFRSLGMMITFFCILLPAGYMIARYLTKMDYILQILS